MLNKTLKTLGIALFGLFLLTFSALPTYAQYYNNGYNYSPIYITTADATNLTSSSAVINGLVNGNNLYSTYTLTTWFNYGTDTNVGLSTVPINSNSGYANFTATLGGLSDNTVYYFRAVAQTPQGVIYGNINTFRTNFAPVTYSDSNNNLNNSNNYYSNPVIITNPATSVSSRSARFNSFIINSPNNPLVTYFEWGTNENLGINTPAISVGSLPSAVQVNTITGLAPNTTYYFRAVGQNSLGKINGVILSFTTNNAPAPTQSTVTEQDNTNNTSVTNTSTINPTENPLGTNLGANVIGSGAFLPGSILEWTILLILILVLIILCKYLYREFGIKETQTVGHA